MRRPSQAREGVMLPLIAADKLWHIGNLNVGDRGARGPSLEGNLFSVSACPAAWRSIAKLGGAPLHASRQPVLLLDMLKALSSPAYQPFREEVTRYGLELGLLQQAEAYKAIRYDDELDGEIYSLHESREEAEEESDEIEAVQMLLATPALKQIHALARGVTPGLEYAMIEWLREHVPSLPEPGHTPIAGVYWDEDYSPGRYSAPRGGLFSPTLAALDETRAWPADRFAMTHVTQAEPLAAEQLPQRRTVTLYHGTEAQFESFSLAHRCSGAGTSVGRLGIWLAQCPSDALSFGSTVLTVEADWKAPYAMPIEELSQLHVDSAAVGDIDRFFDEQRQRLLALGYDSIAVLEGDGRPRSVIALDPESLRIVDRRGPELAGPEL